MWEILNVLERLHRGEGQRAIARVTRHGRTTTAGYLATAREIGWEPGGSAPPTEELTGEVYRRHRPAADRGPGELEEELLVHRERVTEWSTPPPGQKRGLKLTKVHRLLERQGVRVPYSTLHRFAVEHCGFGRRGRVTVRMAECEPGEVAEVDFGRLGLVLNPDSGRRRLAWALVVVLVYSRHQYVHVTHSQKLRDVIDGPEDAWTSFGGVARRLVIDNLKPAILKADPYDPVAQRIFEEYARHRGFVVDATRSADPTGKPILERGVMRVARTRIHGTTRQRRRRGSGLGPWLGPSHPHVSAR